MAKRTLKDIAKSLTLKEIEVANALFENDTRPPGRRKSYEALADELSIGVRTLYEWRHRDTFIEYRHALSVRFESEARTRVMQSVIAGAVEGSAAHAKLYLQTMGMLTDNKTILIEDTTAAVDKADVARRLEELRSKF